MDLRSKHDEAGIYDEHEIDRVVEIALNPNSKQKQLEAAITPVADRLLKQYSDAKLKYKEALSDQDEKSAQACTAAY